VQIDGAHATGGTFLLSICQTNKNQDTGRQTPHIHTKKNKTKTVNLIFGGARIDIHSLTDSQARAFMIASSLHFSQKTPRAVVSANTRKRPPATIPMRFSLMYFDRMAPEATAMPVAVACAPTAPAATEKGFWAAPRAMVERKERSPNSAAKTSEKIWRTLALWCGGVWWGRG
jgi:hypothetical protein